MNTKKFPFVRVERFPEGCGALPIYHVGEPNFVSDLLLFLRELHKNFEPCRMAINTDLMMFDTKEKLLYFTLGAVHIWELRDV